MANINGEFSNLEIAMEYVFRLKPKDIERTMVADSGRVISLDRHIGQATDHRAEEV